MKSKKIKLVIVSLLVFAASTSGGSKDFHTVSDEDASDVLRMIAACIKSNYERINTWEGEIEYTSNWWYYGVSAEKEFRKHLKGREAAPEGIKKTGIGKRNFLIDSKKDTLLIRYIPVGQMSIMDIKSSLSYESTLSALHRPERSVLTTPEYQIECKPLGYRGNEVVRRWGIKRPNSSSFMMILGTQDPRVLLKGIGRPVWSWLESLAQGESVWGDTATVKLEERVHGDGFVDYRIEISYTVGGTTAQVYHILFSGKDNFHMTLHETKDKDGNIIGKETRKFILKEGIYLPSRVTETEWDVKSGKKIEEKTGVFKNMRLNQSIPEGSFTYKNCGLKDGDLLEDKILNKRFKYKENGNHEETSE
ncbi:MAG: hypothetical protein ACUZ8I_05375 [Candidatus Scalindua sp.]